jgi:hypothetical protein
MITLLLTLATMGIFGAHAIQNSEPEESTHTVVIKEKIVRIAYDSPKVDRSLIDGKK